jgi:hypothetical protein
LGSSVQGIEPSLIKALAVESNPYVQIVVAEIMARQFRSLDGVNALVDLVRQQPTHSQTLLALNSLTFVDSALLAGHLGDLQPVCGHSDPILASAATYLCLTARGEYRPGVRTFDMERMMKAFSASK